MKNFRCILAVVAAVSVVGTIGSITALAGCALPPPPPPISSVTGTSETAAAIGLRFEFGDNAPEIVGTVRHTYTDTNNTVTGGLAELAIPLTNKKHFGPKIRAMGLVGSTSVQGEAGIGYDFANQQPLIGVGIQGPYIEGGANYLFDGEFHPYLGIDTFGSAPSATTTIVIPAA